MPLRRLLQAAALFALAGCATGLPAGARASRTVGVEPFSRAGRGHPIPEPVTPPTTEAAPLVIAPGARDAALATARGLIGKSHIVVGGRAYGDDCTGLVRAVYARVGVDLMTAGTSGDNGVTAIWRFAGLHGRIYDGGRPVGGDLVFFRDTYDLNRDGRMNDGLTHVGLVEDVDAEGTITVIHRVARGVVRYRMNLDHRDEATDGQGHPVNDWLRTPMPGAKPQLTAQLFVGFATVLPVESRFAGR